MKKSLIFIVMLTFVSAAFAAADGGAIFSAKCKGCHGANAEKKALGVSDVIKGMPAAEIEKRLNGYKTGKFTDSKIIMMQKQAQTLSADDIKALGEYISKLK